MTRRQPLRAIGFILFSSFFLSLATAQAHSQSHASSNANDLNLDPLVTNTINNNTINSNLTASTGPSLALNATNASTPVINTAACANTSFAAAYPVKLGKSPITMKSFIQGDQVCIQYDLQEPEAGWFAVGFARQASMVSSPPATVMVFERGQANPQLYLIQGFRQNETTLLQDPSAFAPFAAVSQPTGLGFTFQRSLAAKSPTEVPIDPYVGPATLIWAYGDSWPITGHKPGTYGIASYNFISWKSTKHSFCDTNNCPLIIGGSAFGIMLAGGLLVMSTRKSVISHWLLHRSLINPPTKLVSNNKIEWNPITLVLQMLSDFFFGEMAIVAIFGGALWLFVKWSPNDWETTITGRLTVMCMMFIFLPISRIPWLWQTFFGSSFERIVKFHRWLGIFFMVMLIVHIKYSLKYVGLWDNKQAGNVNPLWGTIATICFVVLAVLSIGPIRRVVFELFYYSHRILSILGTVFSILHAPYIGKVMAFSLALYGLSLAWRWLQCFKYFGMNATLQVHQLASNSSKQGGSTLSVVLKPTTKTKWLATHMDACSYFWVNFSSVSMLEWHPFSAIVTPQQDSIGFVIKSMGAGSFSDKLVQYAHTNSQTKVTLCGPFGRIGVNLDDYEVVILVAGGVGITPLLSLLNQYAHFADEESMTLNKKLQKLKEFHVIWSVRAAQDLLMVNEFVTHGVHHQVGRLSTTSSIAEGTAPHPVDMHEAPRVHWMRYVSEAKTTTTINGHEELSVQRSNGEEIFYSPGRPVLDEVINTSRFSNKQQHIAVLACGPPTLVADAQELARACHFDFHKEVFEW